MAEVAEGITSVRVEDAAQIDFLFLCQSPNEGWRRRTFEMQMQFAFRHTGDAVKLLFVQREVRITVCHRKLTPGPWAGTFRWAATEAATSAKATCPILPAPR